MKPFHTISLLGIGLAVLLALPAPAGAQETFSATLRGANEIPSVITRATGSFAARVTGGGASIEFVLTYSGLQGMVTVAHLHIGQAFANGGVSAFLCGGGGKPACPVPPEPNATVTVTGTITADNVGGPANQGVSTGEIGDLINAMRVGLVYANVHSSMSAAGEARGQVFPRNRPGED